MISYLHHLPACLCYSIQLTLCVHFLVGANQFVHLSDEDKQKVMASLTAQQSNITLLSAAKTAKGLQIDVIELRVLSALSK